MQEYFISFGQNHIHKMGDDIFNADNLCCIEAETEGQARAFAFHIFGPKFSMVYTKLPDMKYFPGGVIKISN